MLNIIWFTLMMSGLIVAFATGHVAQVTNGLWDGAKSGVEVAIGLVSIITFWLGIMKIAESARLVEGLSKLVKPIAKWLFPSVPESHPAMGAIIANMSANLLGLGNAATPLGLKAMEELQKLNPTKDMASDAMCTLLALNTASLTIIPATMIGLRAEFHSKNPADIVLPTLLATAIATTAAIILDRFYRHRHQVNHPCKGYAK